MRSTQSPLNSNELSGALAETTHTPGEWTIDDAPEYSDIGIEKEGATIAVVLNSDSFLCAEEADADRIDAEARANARLIAAAPDLLFACQQAAKHMTFLKALNQSDEIDEAYCLHGLLTEAITKATTGEAR